VDYNVRACAGVLSGSLFALFIALGLVLSAPLPPSLQAQNLLSNPGFENWTDEFPDDWFAPNIPPMLVPVTPSTNSHSGEYAAKCEVVAWMDTVFGGWVMQKAGAPGSAFTCDFYYLFEGTGTDWAWVEVALYSGELPVGVWVDSLQFAASYTHHAGVAEVEQGQPDADSAVVMLGMWGDQVGSYALFDDVSLTAGVLVEDGEGGLHPEGDGGSRILWAAPNPFGEHVSVEYALGRPASVSVRVYAVTGQLVSVLVQGPEAAGVHRAVWDGRDLRGSRVADGIYFLRLEAGEEVDSHKLVVLH
jgi:hypothetical protein